MSDLQIILIILGAFIIAGVVVYNWLQEKKLHSQVTQDFIVPQKDVLTEDFYIDTDAFVEKELAEVSQKIKQQVLDHLVDDNMVNVPATADPVIFKNKVLQDTVLKETPLPESTAKETSFKQATFKPSSQDNVIESDANANAVSADKTEQTQAVVDNTPPQLPSNVHPQIDLTAILYANKNIQCQDLLAMSESLDDITLPMMIYGLDDADKWHAVETHKALQTEDGTITFKQVACSLQLADRGGPVARNVLNKFQFAVESMGLELNAHVEWQGSGDVLQRAIALDQFCIEVDQLINIHVAQDEAPIHGTKFRGLAEVNGMTLNDDGKFYYLNHDANSFKLPLFSAIEANNQAFTAESLRNSVLKAITFQLEIPKVPNCEQAFNQMIVIAQKLSASLNARLVDDNQKPLGDLQIEKIRQQLKIIHATMVARGVMPGSSASMRLFN